MSSYGGQFSWMATPLLKRGRGFRARQPVPQASRRPSASAWRSEHKAAQTLGTRACRNDPRAALHHDLEPYSVERLDRDHVVEIYEMRPVDSQEICCTELRLKIRQPDAHKILLGCRANRDIV